MENIHVAQSGRRAAHQMEEFVPAVVMLIAFVGGEVRLQPGMHGGKGLDERALVADHACLYPAVVARFGMKGEGWQALAFRQRGQRAKGNLRRVETARQRCSGRAESGEAGADALV